jgi:hypothetical protein
MRNITSRNSESCWLGAIKPSTSGRVISALMTTLAAKDRKCLTRFDWLVNPFSTSDCKSSAADGRMYGFCFISSSCKKEIDHYEG